MVTKPGIKDSTISQILQEFERQNYARVQTEYPHPKAAHHERSLTATFQGKYIHLKIRTASDNPPPRGKRGTISDFSPQSRRRLFDLMNSLEIKRRCVFLTLTYGDEYVTTKRAKDDLRAFLARIGRMFPDDQVSAIWRMEFQERGAPHFHLVLFSLPFIKKEDIQAMWGDIIGLPNVFTRIAMIHNYKKLTNYVSKYLAKVNPPEQAGDSGFNAPTYLHAYIEKYDCNIGRLWGYFNKSAIPFAPCATYEIPLNYAKFFKFRDLAIKIYPALAERRSLSFRLYVGKVDRYRDFFERLMRDEIVKFWYPLIDHELALDFTETKFFAEHLTYE